MTFCVQGQQPYYVETIGGIDTVFEINLIGELTSANVQKENLLPSSCPSRINPKDVLEEIAKIRSRMDEAVLLIWKRLDGVSCHQTGEPLQLEFKQLIEDHFSKKPNIDLSNLGLKTLPPQISLFKHAKSLNLSGNELHLLPPELQRLPYLETLDISGNKDLKTNIPSWIGKKPWTIIANNMDLRFLPEGLKPEQVISDVVDFTSDEYGMQFAQTD